MRGNKLPYSSSSHLRNITNLVRLLCIPLARGGSIKKPDAMIRRPFFKGGGGFALLIHLPRPKRYGLAWRNLQLIFVDHVGYQMPAIATLERISINLVSRSLAHR
jgi:hypothetical protein